MQVWLRGKPAHDLLALRVVLADCIGEGESSGLPSPRSTPPADANLKEQSGPATAPSLASAAEAVEETKLTSPAVPSPSPSSLLVTSPRVRCLIARAAIGALWEETSFRDYIAAPKANGYASIHSRFALPSGAPLEARAVCAERARSGRVDPPPPPPRLRSKCGLAQCTGWPSRAEPRIRCTRWSRSHIRPPPLTLRLTSRSALWPQATALEAAVYTAMSGHVRYMSSLLGGSARAPRGGARRLAPAPGLLGGGGGGVGGRPGRLAAMTELLVGRTRRLGGQPVRLAPVPGVLLGGSGRGGSGRGGQPGRLITGCDDAPRQRAPLELVALGGDDQAAAIRPAPTSPLPSPPAATPQPPPRPLIMTSGGVGGDGIGDGTRPRRSAMAAPCGSQRAVAMSDLAP